MNLNLRDYVRELSFNILCGVIFSIPAFINGFPLVTSDTGTYINSGFDLWVPTDRPIVYGLFIKQFSFRESLWFVIIIQGILLSWLISKIIKGLLPAFSNFKHRLIIILVLSIYAAPAWYSSQIMPDIFVSLSVLGFILIIINQQWSIFSKILIPALYLFSILTHNSYLPLCSLLAIIFFIWGVLFKKFKKYNLSVIRLYFVISLTLLGWLISPFVNFLVDGNFRITGSPHVFIVARLSETGILTRYLDDNCHFITDASEINPTYQYVIQTRHSYKVFDIPWGSNEGKPLTQFNFNNTPNQRFNIITQVDGLYKFQNVESHRFLTANPLKEDINSITELPGKNDSSQEFEILKVDNGFFKIKSNIYNKNFDVAGNEQNNGARIQLWKDLDADNQKFRITSDTACKLCLYKERLPNSAIVYLWADNNILSLTGDWDKSKKEYNKAILGTLTSSKFLLWNIREAIIATFRQLIHNDVGNGLVGYDRNSSPYLAIKKHLPKDLQPLSASDEFNTYSLNFESVNKRVYTGLIISVLLLIVYLSKKSDNKEYLKLKFVVIVIVSSIIFNAFITGALANVLDRLQSRISWLLVLATLIIYYPLLVSFLSRIFNFQTESNK